MNRVFRAFLIWAMVIAMPVQGMAASMMLFCGPSHARMMSGLVGQAAADAGVHDHAAAGHDHAAHATHAVVSADPDNGSGAASPHIELTCSACAACCSVLALPMSFSLPAATDMAHPMHAAPSVLPSSHEPDRLDRPPRSTFA